MAGRVAGTTWSEERASSIISNYRHQRGALLPMLHGLQLEFGCIEDEAILLLADALNLSRAEVHGVVSFYHDFRRTRPGRHVIKVCRAEACQAMGANVLLDHMKSHLSVDVGETTDDGTFTLEAVYCLGNCALPPALMVDDQLLGRVDISKFEALVQTCRDDML